LSPVEVLVFRGTVLNHWHTVNSPRTFFVFILIEVVVYGANQGRNFIFIVLFFLIELEEHPANIQGFSPI